MDQIKSLSSILSWLPPLRKPKNPSVALVVGFVAGGIGLGVYFLSLVDVIIPVATVIVLAKVVGPAGVLGGAIVAALYGYARALSSNQRIAAQSAVAAAPFEPERLTAGPRRGVSLKDLIDAGVLLPGARLTRSRDGAHYEATVNADGTLELPGNRRASSLSAAAELARGRRANGWTFWTVETQSGPATLSALRDQAMRERARGRSAG
jgi:hypothetical protein